MRSISVGTGLPCRILPDQRRPHHGEIGRCGRGPGDTDLPPSRVGDGLPGPPHHHGPGPRRVVLRAGRCPRAPIRSASSRDPTAHCGSHGREGSDASVRRRRRPLARPPRPPRPPHRCHRRSRRRAPVHDGPQGRAPHTGGQAPSAIRAGRTITRGRRRPCRWRLLLADRETRVVRGFSPRAVTEGVARRRRPRGLHAENGGRGARHIVAWRSATLRD